MSARTAPFPWGSLPRLPRHAVTSGRAARRAVARSLHLEGLAGALRHLVATEVTIQVHEVSAADPTTARETLPDARFALRLSDGSAEILVGVDPALATDALRRVLGRPTAFDNPRASWSPSLQGALEAVALELVRHSSQDRGIATVVAPVATEVGPAVLVRSTVSVEGRPHAASALVRVLQLPSPDPSDGQLRRAVFPVALPLVVGVCEADRTEMRDLALGDAFSAGDGWTIDTEGVGQGVLVGPGSELGAVVDLAPDGALVVRNETRRVPIEQERWSMDDATEVTGAVTETVGETPVVVRIELGSVSLLARDWAQLAVGDVIGTDQRIGEPVRLRIGGREVARGELCNVEGELAVRITALHGEVES